MNWATVDVGVGGEGRHGELLIVTSAKILAPSTLATESHTQLTGFSSEIGTKLHDWAVRQAGGSCYSQAALSSNDSKTL